MQFRTRFTSYEEFQREVFSDPGRALSPEELELMEDLLEEAAAPAAPVAPPRRAPLPRWRPPALASLPQIAAGRDAPVILGIDSAS